MLPTALFYYVLGNVSPMYRSTMKSIQLLAITKSTVLQSYGADRVLENFMEDIGELEVSLHIISTADVCYVYFCCRFCLLWTNVRKVLYLNLGELNTYSEALLVLFQEIILLVSI